MSEEAEDRVVLMGQEIDVVKVRHLGGYGSSYSFYYGVPCDVEGIEKQMRARMKLQTKGLIRRQVVDFKWVGGALANDLNRDDELKTQLLQQLKIDVRDSVEISPDKKAGIVWITTTKVMSPFPESATPFSIPDDIMPSETSFESYNAIARHIRNRSSAQSG